MKAQPRARAFLIFCVMISVVSFGFQTNPAYADVPDVLSTEPWTSGTVTFLNITVRHASPTSSHYVNRVEIDVDGTVKNVELTPPQVAPAFVLQYDMGEVTAMPTVQARAHCNIHGWSGWSDPIVVPEFSIVLLPIVLAVVSIAISLLKPTLSSPKKVL